MCQPNTDLDFCSRLIISFGLYKLQKYRYSVVPFLTTIFESSDVLLLRALGVEEMDLSFLLRLIWL